MHPRIEFISRIIGALVLGAALAIIGVQLAALVNLDPLRYGIAFGVGGGVLGVVLGFLFTPYVTVRPINAVRQALSAMPLERLISLMIGVFLGLIAAALFSIPLSQLPSPLREILPLASALGFCYLGAVLMMNRYRDLRDFLGALRPSRGADKVVEVEKKKEDEPVILLDTSVIIDGRILDIARTGFIRQTLLVPNFVLKELQHIADSPDSLRRNRGRRGLDILSMMQNESPVPVRITDMDAPQTRDADSKLVLLARRLTCPIMTNDYNLNKVAELQGITVLNINDLANAVKASFLPGEELSVTIIQEGKEYGQGVGYLDDGTMVVVEDGYRLMNRTEHVVVTKVLQTTAGRMIFAKP
ncbi:PIN/TRAM domain-containing protein [Promineifilum sp.]|uniref:PIN/TRAM domain-containing protein n=1 Tax=Promineifilum sp. TaxID=2664178 RepID=UPI0035B131AD